MTVILLRHGVSVSNLAGTLAGRAPGVKLAEQGQQQAREIAQRLGGLPLTAIVRSPMTRCAETVEPLALKLGLEPVVDDRLAEVDYGEWTGRHIASVTADPVWKTVQRHASAAVFPGGEGLAQVQFRAVAAVRDHDQLLAAAAGRDTLWVACTHGDVIKAVLADALGMHLDSFQRLIAEPASISVIRYTPHAVHVLRVNDTGGDLAGLTGIAHPTPGGETAQPRTPDNESAGAPDSR